eukprot:jgi/Tetstr1/455122/TSEL_041974.t1
MGRPAVIAGLQRSNMAPKKAAAEEKAAPAAPEWDGPMVLLDVTLTSCTQLFPAPSAEEGKDPPPVQMVYAAVSFLGAPPTGITTEPVHAEEDGSYKLNVVQRLALPLNHATLEGLLNTPLSIRLGTQMAEGKKMVNVEVVKATLDLLPFGLGQHEVQEGALALQALELPEGLEVMGSASVEVRVSLVQEEVVPPHETPEPSAGVEGSEAAPAEPTVVYTPCPLLSEQEASEGRVATLGVELSGALPEGLEAAAALAGPELSLKFALWLPSVPARKLAELDPDDGPSAPRVMALAQGAVVPGDADQLATVKFSDTGRRFYLAPDVVAAMSEALEDRTPLLLEFARALKVATSAYVDNAVDMFHGITRLDMAALADPGAASHEATVKFKKSFGETKAAGRVHKSMLEPLGPPEVNLKGKLLAEGVEFPPVPGADPRPCAWAAAETSLTVSLSLSAPLFPPWEPPPKPVNTLEEMVPKRNLEKIVEPKQASDDFRSEVRRAAKSLAADYMAMFGEELEREKGPYAQEKVMAARQRKLVFELNRTGKYLELKDTLRGVIVRVVQEKYKKSGAMGYDEMRELYNDLYVYLMDEMHRSLNDLIKGPKKRLEPVVPDSMRLAQLQALADEYEVNEDFKRASRCHTERLLASKNPEVWYSYGSFLSRMGDVGKAVEAFKEVVALDPGNLDGLLCLASLLWEEGATQDVQFMERADSIAQSAIAQSENNGVGWALLALLYADKVPHAPEHRREEAAASARNARFKAVTLCQGAQAQGLVGLAANFFLQLALMLLDLKLGKCAAKALAVAGNVPWAEQVRVEMALCCSRAASLQEQPEAAIKHLKDAMRHGDKKDVRPHILMGHVLYKTGQYKDAAVAYQHALSAEPARCPLEMYIRLGSCFLVQEQHQFALNVYTQACAARPCASTWLGAGIASLRMGDLKAADLAFTEANILNPHNPLVWGFLTLSCLQGDRVPESEMALQFAYKEELEDAELMLEIAGAYMGRGMYKEAESVLSRSIPFADGPPLRAMLGDALYEQNELPAAVDNYLAVVQADGKYAADKADSNAVHCLGQLGKCFVTLGDEAAQAELEHYSEALFRVPKWMETATIHRRPG